MYEFKLVFVFVLSMVFIGIRSESGEDDESWPRHYRPQYYRHRESFRGYGFRRRSSCDAKMDEAKSRIQNLEQLVVGLRKKLNPNFRPTWPLPLPTQKPATDFKLQTTTEAEVKCPLGFQYVNGARSCYKVIYEGHNWTSADQRCHDLHPDAHLVAITTRKEDTALQTYLTGELAKNAHIDVCKMRSWGDPNKMLWTSLQRQNETSCDSPFVWKISNGTHLPLSSYTHWSDDEPNCGGDHEFCVHIRPTNTFEWNDLPCHDRYKLCPLCEVDPL